MLHWRLLSAAVIISIAVTAVWLDAQFAATPGLWLMPIGLVVAMLAADEVQCLLGLAKNAAHRMQLALLSSLQFAIAATPIWYQCCVGTYPADCPVGRAGWLGIGVVVVSLLWFAHEVFWFCPEGQDRAIRIAKTVFVFLYPISLLSTAVLIRQTGPGSFGLAVIVGVIAIAKVSDAGAYFGGKSLGRRPLARSLSPKKTWEGAVCGAVAGVVCAGVYFAYIAPACFDVPAIRGSQLWRSALFGAALVLAGMVGDLFESLLKRDAGVKDSSSWLPGLGGILDTIDSLLFAFPCAYLMGVINWDGLPST